MLTAYAEVECGLAESGGANSEQQRLLAYAPLVKRIVRQLGSQTGACLDAEDMQQIGLLALLNALRRYGEPDARFGAYAAMRVRGAILDELRRQDWRPRTVRQESHRTRDAVRELARRLGRPPTPAQIREALGVTPAAYREQEMAQSAEQFASFDEALHELCDAPESPEAQMLARRSIEQALLRLDEREKRVVQLYYEYDLNLKEIAAVLDLTEARVCQINKAALKKLKDFLQ